MLLREHKAMILNTVTDLFQVSLSEVSSKFKRKGAKTNVIKSKKSKSKEENIRKIIF
jgi:hypothetical protein